MMTLKKISTLTILILATTTLFCQSPLKDSISGTWYLTNTFKNDTLIYSRTADNLYGWGQRIEIFKDARFVDGCTAKCGVDGSKHTNNGEWKLEPSTRILNTSIPISYDHHTKHQILKVTGDWLILKKVD